MAHRRDFILGGIIFVSLGIFVILFLVLLFSLGGGGDVKISGAGSKVALVEVEGVIWSSQDLVRQLQRYQKDESVKAIVLRIDSPGGGVAASQEIYERVKKVRDSGKPVIASMGGVAASGGYYIALGADTIMANKGTTTGSIGVIAEIPNFQKLLDKIGIEFTIIKSGKYKDSGSPYREVTSEDREYFQDWIDDAYEQFVDAVAVERHLSDADVRQIADGRVFTGVQALEYSLIDTIGTYEDAIQLAALMGGIKGEPRTISAQQRRLTLFDIITGDIRQFLTSQLGTWPRLKYQLVL